LDLYFLYFLTLLLLIFVIFRSGNDGSGFVKNRPCDC